MWKFTKTVALEQHMDNITVAVAAPGRQPPEFCDDVPSTSEAVRKLMGRLDDGKMDLRFRYEAGPCGYELSRQLTMLGYDCSVVAPSLSPRVPVSASRPIRRDALTLARQHRSGTWWRSGFRMKSRKRSMIWCVAEKTSSTPSVGYDRGSIPSCFDTVGCIRVGGAERRRTSVGWKRSASVTRPNRSRFRSMWTASDMRDSRWKHWKWTWCRRWKPGLWHRWCGP